MRRTLRFRAAPPLGIKDPQLSQRERQILTHLAEGDSNKQIARAFNITESTVKVHLKAILRKITAQNRTQAAISVIAKGYHVITDTNTRHSPAGRVSGNGEAAEIIG
jgi:DNA-binding NarL/FixJ family response regulator